MVIYQLDIGGWKEAGTLVSGVDGKPVSLEIMI